MDGREIVMRRAITPTTTINSIRVKARRRAEAESRRSKIEDRKPLRCSTRSCSGLRPSTSDFRLVAISVLPDSRRDGQERGQHAEEESTHANGHDDDHGWLEQVREHTQLDAQLVL